MKTFHDNAGRQWAISINVDAIKRVRKLANVDLLEAGDPNKSLFTDLSQDFVLLVDVLYAICEPEAKTLEISDEEFGRAMAGDVIEQATEAFLEELVNFTPSPRDRARQKRILAKLHHVVDRTQDVLDARADDPALDAMVEERLTQLGDSSISLQEWLESPRDRSASAS